MRRRHGARASCVHKKQPGRRADDRRCSKLGCHSAVYDCVKAPLLAQAGVRSPSTDVPRSGSFQGPPLYLRRTLAV